MAYLLPATYDLPFNASDTSREAAERARAFHLNQSGKVLWWFQQHPQGATQAEASAALGIARASMAARVHALTARGELIRTSRRREGCAIYSANER